MHNSKHILHNRIATSGPTSPVSWRVVSQFLAFGAAFAFVTALVCGVI